ERAASGTITLGSTARIDVSGGIGGGTVHVRAPLLVDHDVAVQFGPGEQITGARDVTVEAYATWSTLDATTGAQHFDGVIDPAGWYSAAGTQLPGTTVAGFFTPASANASHVGFYGDTLGNFVRAPFGFESRFAGIQNLSIRAGIDLLNPSGSVNQGDIAVLSNWNLGAGQGAAGTASFSYRHDGAAPVLSLRAVHDINFSASLSDGFFQYSNPLGTLATDNSASPVATAGNPLPLLTANLAGGDSSSYRIVAGAEAGSADPLALGGSDGSVTLNGHTTAVFVKNAGGATADMVAPTMIRTGTGTIDIVAATDVSMTDPLAPGVIYTGGRPADGTTAPTVTQVIKGKGNIPVLIDTGDVQPVDAGDLSISAGRDIIGIERVIDSSGRRSGRVGTNLTQLWWPWMERSCVFTDTCGTAGAQQDSSIGFGIFDQGIMSVGGDITVAAGRNLQDLSVSLPATWRITTGTSPAVTTYGGGDARISAGGNLYSGAYFAAAGRMSLAVGGSVSAELASASGAPIGTFFALQDGQLRLSAAGDINVAGLFDPSYLYTNFDSQGYSAASSFSATSSAGSIAFNSLAVPVAEYGFGNSTLAPAYSAVLPATLELTALNGGITIARKGELYPSAQGNLELLAQDSIRLYQAQGGDTSNRYFGLIDAPASVLPSPLSPIGALLHSATTFLDRGGDSALSLHTDDPLHAQDGQPVLVYSLEGDIIDGDANHRLPLTLFADKPAQIRAGRDVVDLSLRGQNLYDSDITLIAAGRDIVDSPLTQSRQVPLIQLGGIGTLGLQAGRDIGPLTSAVEALHDGLLPANNTPYPGIFTVGNLFNAHLDHAGANLAVLFGVGPGMTVDDFAAAYIDPAHADIGFGPENAALVQFVSTWQADQQRRSGQPASTAQLSADDAWQIFQTLPLLQRQRFASMVLFDVLNQTGLDFNKPDSLYFQQYQRGYAAIERLFPAALGYTHNDLTGALNGALAPVATGTFDMRGSTLQTQQGGDIAILGPGGSVLIGSAAAPPSVAGNSQNARIGPNNQGILTLERGNIDLFADRDVLLAQSRIFTEQGGDLVIWSSNGDINAGKGAKTTTEVPPAQYFCDNDHYCRVDAKSQVSGAGIATLQSRPEDPAGNANLIAPHGTIDAGDAGIRSAGALNVAALRVANADNIQVSGKTSGVPTGQVDTGALAAASSVSAAVEQSASQASLAKPADTAATLITVEVVGYGGDGTEE
ncbi:MAG TPA: filamentous hemagglutinin family protein, partial [Nevskiaceae bacterium]|nr:filamentous hemagglutinin family protein [Nevskiaceae bacterium]